MTTAAAEVADEYVSSPLVSATSITSLQSSKEEPKKICYREFSEVPETDNFLAYELASLFSGASLTDNANTDVVKLGDDRV